MITGKVEQPEIYHIAVRAAEASEDVILKSLWLNVAEASRLVPVFDRNGELCGERHNNLNVVQATLKQITALSGGKAPARGDTKEARIKQLQEIIDSPSTSTESRLKAIQLVSQLEGDLNRKDELTITNKSYAEMSMEELDAILAETESLIEKEEARSGAEH